MAIIGDLSEFSLPEVFNMVGHFVGKMRFLDIPECGFLELHLIEGNLCALLYEGKPARDILQVQDKMSPLVTLRQGLFEFHKAPVDEIRFDFSISILNTLMRLTCAVDEIAGNQQFFPDPEALFVIQDRQDVSLDDNLVLFLRHSRGMLEQGANCQQIAGRLELSLERVQLCMYKLRALGIVTEWVPEEAVIVDTAPVLESEISPLKILLVEDDPQLANYLRRGLGRILSLIAIAGNLEDARAYLGNHFQFDAVVCDYWLPDGNALDLLQWLRTEQSNSAPFLMISGKEHENPPSDPLFSFLAKPFEPQNLLERIQEMAGMQRA